MGELSSKDELFIAYYLQTCNAARAAILVGSNPRSASKAANKLLARADIQAEIERRTAEIAADSAISVKSLIAEAEAARLVAEAAGNSAGMSQAIGLKAKLAGLLTDRPQSEDKPTIIVNIVGDDAKLL